MNKDIIIRNNLALGDVVVSSAVIRDLANQYPDQFNIYYRGSCRDVFINNPYLKKQAPHDTDEFVLKYPLVHKSSDIPNHFIQAYHPYLSEMLGVKIDQTLGRGDIHLSDQEKQAPSLIEKITSLNLPFWVIASGGKKDFTNKWWDYQRYQEVVDHFQGKILFAQVGKLNYNNNHPSLNGVLDLREKTNIRELINLIYRSKGVVCGVTSFMHLAAADYGNNDAKPCVVVAGGREPSSWEAYPWHRYLHTQGALDCCLTGGCWKSRVQPLGDGSKKDKSLCLKPIEIKQNHFIPKCLDMITSGDVIKAMYSYLDEGFGTPFLTKKEYENVKQFLSVNYKG